MTARQSAIAAIATHKVAPTTDYSEHAGEAIYGEYVFHEARPAPVPRQADLQGAPPHDRRPRAVRSGHRRRRRARREGVGARARRDPLHPLVRADDRLHRREARLVPEPDRRRPHDRRVLRPDADPGRAGRVVVPVGRHPRHVRGPRLHRVGRDVADLPPGRAQRRHDDHPDRLHLVHRRGARLQDPAPALAGGPGQAGAARPALVRQHRRDARVHEHRPRAGVLPRRPPPGRAAARPAAHRPDAVRRPVAQGPGAGGPVLRPDPRADPRVHDGSRPRAVAPGHPGQDAPQRGRAGPVRDGAGVRADVGRLRPQHDRDVDDAPARAAARPRCSSSTRSRSPASTARASTTTGRWRPTRARTCSTRAPTRTPTRSSWRSCSPSSARSTSTPTSCARRSPTPARTTAWAPTRHRRRSCRSSSARSSRTSSGRSRRAPRPSRRRAAPSSSA